MSLTVRFEIIDEAEEEPAIDLKKLSMAGNPDLKKFMMRLALKKAMAAKRQEPAPVEIETLRGAPFRDARFRPRRGRTFAQWRCQGRDRMKPLPVDG